MVRDFGEQRHVLEDQLRPVLVTALALLVVLAVGVGRAAVARVEGGQDDLNLVELEQVLVDGLLELGERAQNDVVSLAWELELDRRVVLCAVEAKKGASESALRETRVVVQSERTDEAKTWGGDESRERGHAFDP